MRTGRSLRRATALRATIHAGEQSRGSARPTLPPPPPPRSLELHEDILCFAKQFRETSAEQAMRAAAFDRASNAIQMVHHGAKAHIFGSTATSLRLPHAVTDVMIEAPSADKGALIDALAAVLPTFGASSIVAPTSRRRPILKWCDIETDVRLEACVNDAAALRSTARLAGAVADPALAPLVLVLKAQLLLHGMDRGYKGGVGGYLLSNMVRHLLARRAELATRYRDLGEGGRDLHVGDHDLGGLLLLFYWYYGFGVSRAQSCPARSPSGAMPRGPS